MNDWIPDFYRNEKLPNPAASARIQDSMKPRRKPMAKAIGKERGNGISSVRLNSPNPNLPFGRAAGMINALGYEIAVQRRKTKAECN